MFPSLFRSAKRKEEKERERILSPSFPGLCESITADISRGTLRKRRASTQKAIELERERGTERYEAHARGKNREKRVERESKRESERERERERERESLQENEDPFEPPTVRVTHFCGDERGCTVEMSIKRVGQ